MSRLLLRHWFLHRWFLHNQVLRKRLILSLMTATTTLMVVGSGWLPTISASEVADEPWQIGWQHQVLAQSGGRSSGGSFGSSGSGSSSRGSSGSGSSSRSSGSYYRNSYSSYDSGSNYSGNGEASIYVWGLLLGILILMAVFSGHEKEEELPQTTVRSEKDNDIVTVTQIQVAMKVEDEAVKRSLNKIATDPNWSSTSGLRRALQETVDLLMATPENWTHASGKSSTSYTREQGSREFSALSMAARSKFEVASLVNIDGNIHYDSNSPSTSDQLELDVHLTNDAAASDEYLVITLIVGTAHDQPLLYKIDSADRLADKLRLLRTVPPGYLFKYELLWSPQAEDEALTASELTEKYPSLTQIGNLTAHAKLVIRES